MNLLVRPRVKSFSRHSSIKDFNIIKILYYYFGISVLFVHFCTAVLCLVTQRSFSLRDETKLAVMASD